MEQIRIKNLIFTFFLFISIFWVGYEAFRFIFEPTSLGGMAIHPGAIDLKSRYHEQNWFYYGGQIYDVRCPYPPFSYAFFRFYFGLFSLNVAKNWWMLTMLGNLLFISFVLVKVSFAKFKEDKRILWVLPSCLYSAGACIGNGQKSLLVMAGLIGVPFLLQEKLSLKMRDFLIVLFLCFASIKPNISLPFFILFFTQRDLLRPLLLFSLFYSVVTILFSRYQGVGAIAVIKKWLGAAISASSLTDDHYSHSNIQTVIKSLAENPNVPLVEQADYLSKLNLYSSFTLVSIAAIWFLYNRRGNLWNNLALASLVSMSWTYHGWYDEVLLIFPIVALIRICFQENRDCIFVKPLLILFVISLMAPGGHFVLKGLSKDIYHLFQIKIWILTGIYLINHELKSKGLDLLGKFLKRRKEKQLAVG